jgi:excisionase family DNA binding protein
MDNRVLLTASNGGLMPSGAALEYLGGVSIWTLKALVKRGLLKSVKIGRRRLFARADLDRYIESLRQPAENGGSAA